MPDVGVLSLQIEENSKGAYDGLDKLVDVLTRVKNAVEGGMKLTPVANGLKKIGDVVNESISGSTIVKIGQIADELSKLKGLENINIRINTGTSVQSIREAVQETVDSVHGIESGFTNVGERVVDVNEAAEKFYDTMDKTGQLMENMGMGGGYQQFKQMLNEFLHMRSAMALGPGTQMSPVGEETGWTEWKNGAIEVEGYVSEVHDKIEGIADVPKLNSGIEVFDRIEDAAMAAGIPVEEAKRKIQEMRDSIVDLGNAPVFSTLEEAAEYLGISMDEARRMVHQTVQEARSGAKPKAIDKIRESAMRAGQTVERLRERVKALSNAAGESKLGKLANQFARIAKYRFLRAVLKHITEGFSEGVQNVYEYSKAIGSSFAPAMDSAATSLLQMKNSIGAAAAPLIQSLIPLMQTLVGWFIEGVNYLNQFLALLRGQSKWTRAVPATTSAFGKQEKAAKKAGNAIKDLLADWDELNIIQSQTSGAGDGAGTGAAEDYLKMFEEVSEFEDGIESTVRFLKENFESLKTAAIGIGAAILGWKISTGLSSVLGTLGTLTSTVATIAFTLSLTDAFGRQYANTGEPGWFIADALTSAVGSTLAWKLASSFLGGGWGLITAGFTLTLSGAIDLKNSKSAFTQKRDAESQMLSILGSVKNGIGAALIAAGFTASAPVAGTIGALAAAVSYAVNALAKVNITGIAWGDNTLSAEDVDAFVKSEMLGVDIEAQIKITHAAIELAEGEDAALSVKATELLAPVNTLKLGVDIDGSLEKIKEDVFGSDGLLAQFKKFTSAQKELVNTAETYVPTIDENGNNISKELMSESNGAWNELNKLMDDLGRDLSTHLTRAMDKTLSEELRQFELNAVSEITDTMIRVSLAGKRATIGSDSLANLSFDLADATKGTYQDVLNAYKEYKERLTSENRELKKAEAASFSSAAAQYQVYANDALEKAGGDTTDELYRTYAEKAKDFADRYKEIMDDLANSVKTSVDEAAAPGRDLVRKSIETMLAGAREVRDGRIELFTGGKIKGLPTAWAGGIKENTQAAMNNLWYAGIRDGITSENAADLERLYKEWLDAMLKDFMPNDFDMFKEMIDQGIINYDTFFDPDALFSYMENVRHMDATFEREMWDRLFGEKKGKSGFIGHLANAGFSDVGGMGLPPTTYVTPSANTAEENEASISKGVQSGMQGMQTEQRNLLSELIRIVNKISNKEFSVNVTPGAAWGAHNAKSGEAYDNVVGG